MTRQRLEQLVGEYGLRIAVDRITSGTVRSGFHTFEITGPHYKLREFACVVREERGCHSDFVKLLQANDGELYCSVESMWM